MAIWISDIDKAGGFADASRGYLCALASVGYEDVAIKALRPITWGSNVDLRPGGPYAPLRKFAGADLSRPSSDTVVVHMFPTEAHRFVVTGARNVCLTAWETDELPPSGRFILNYSFKEVWIPSTQNATALAASGVTVPVHVVPHALGPAVRPARPTPPWALGRYVFYYIGAWNERKNPAAVVRAYLRTFKADEPVCLLVKTWTDAVWTGEKAEEIPPESRVANIAKEVGFGVTWPRVVTASGVATADDIDWLHSAGDCYVSAHRGEAFGLAIARAKQFGHKVIATGWGGPTDFLDPAVDDLIPFTLSPVSGMEFRPGFDTGRWAEPDVDALAAAMRKAFDTKAVGSAAGMDRFSWETVGNLLAERLGPPNLKPVAP